MISFVTVRRGDWILKMSVYKNKQIMVIAHHCFDLEKLVIKCFYDQNTAVDFIDNLVKDDNEQN